MDSLLTIFDECDLNQSKPYQSNDDYRTGKRKKGLNNYQHLHHQMISSSKSLLSLGATSLPPEVEQGNIEYKLKLVNPSSNRLEHLVTQMKWRLEEGNGEAIYEIGVENNGDLKGLTDDEIQASLKTLKLMADKNNASLYVIREKLIENVNNIKNQSKNHQKFHKALEILVKKMPNDKQALEIRISVLGMEEAGKSSLLGVLTQGELDNGKGRARLNLFRHRHEIRTGRTSSINKEILGFDSRGKPITYFDFPTSEEICQLSSKIVVFIDSGGHPKYLKTAVFSLTATHADYAILVINPLTKTDCGTNLLHLSLAIAFEVPVLVVINKIDLCDQSAILDCLENVHKFINSSISNKASILTIQSEDDVIYYKQNRSKQKKIIPIFLISCVTGDGLQLIYKFLHQLEPTTMDSNKQCILSKTNTVFQIDDTFKIPNLGIVVSGFLNSGLIEEGSLLKAGPLNDGTFIDVCVRSVQRHKVSRCSVRPGESSTLALELINKQSNNNSLNGLSPLSKIVRKGMVLLSQIDSDCVCHYFQAKIFSMPHSGVISFGSTAIIYIENVRQCGVIITIQKKEQIFENESAIVIIRFLRRPEYIRKGYRFLLQQERIKAIGHVIKVFF
ncbi:hypothetical protein NH340_JMT05947 [Sarcoptes scabiei]|nr:hypothetical protein NH340_JMT05947 [Sarcoptes scabiei]